MSLFRCHVFCPAIFSLQFCISSAWVSSSRDGTKEGLLALHSIISHELSPQLSSYILSLKVCGSMLTQYFKHLPVVASFPDDFQRIDSAYIQLQDGHHCLNKQSSNAMEIVCSSFGFITTLLPHSSLKSSEFISQLRDLLNTVDLSDISVDEQNESQANKEPRASQHLEMPMTPRNKTSSSVAMTSPYSGNLKRAKNKNVSPNLKEISEKEDLDTPEKVLLMKQWSSRIIKDVHDVCERNGESLAMVLSNMCIWRPRSEGHSQWN